MFQKGLAPIPIIILIALAILSGFFIYQKQFKPVYIPQPVKQVSSTAPTSVATSSAEATNWKTYTNTEYKYSFKYPSGWSDITTQEEKPNSVSLEIGIKDREYYFKVGRNTPTLSGISTAYDMSSYDFQNGNIHYSGIKAQKEGVVSLISVQPDFPYSVGGRIQISFPPSQSEAYAKIFDQILSTFKFLP